MISDKNSSPHSNNLAIPKPEATIGGNYVVLRFDNGYMLAIHFGPDWEFKPEVAYEIATSGGFPTCNISVLDGYGTVLEEMRRIDFAGLADCIRTMPAKINDPQADRVFAEKRLALKKRPIGWALGAESDE